MRASSTRKLYRPAFEFQRGGPYIKGSAAHKPDLSLAINRIAQQQQIITPTARSARTPRRSKQVTLDMFSIAEDCGTLKYSHITELNLSGKKLNSIDLTALRDLGNLVKLDLSDNYLKLEPFGILPKLEELDFSCNNLISFTFDKNKDKDKFQSLKKLNLNFNSIGDSFHHLVNFSNLEYLTVSRNNLTFLPSDMGKFEKIEYLDLSYNQLNTNSCFVALASLPKLSILILDNNGIINIPKLQFGFAQLIRISLKNNKIESSDDILTLGDLEKLKEVDITNNPINVHRREVEAVKEVYSLSNIKLIYSMEIPSSFKARAPRQFHNLVKVDFDPLLLPSKELRKKFHTDKPQTPDASSTQESHNLDYETDENQIDENDDLLNEDFQKDRQQPKIRPNRNIVIHNFEENPNKIQNKTQNDVDDDDFDNEKKKSTQEKVETDVFMTDFSEIAPTPLPAPAPLPQNEEIFSIWKDVPVISEDSRKPLSNQKSVEKFNDAFKKLKFIVQNPKVLLKNPKPNNMQSMYSPRSSYAQSARSNRNSANITNTNNDIAKFPTNSPPKPRAKSTRNKKPTENDIKEKINKEEKISKDELFLMLNGMENRLDSAQETIDEADADGVNPVDAVLDQTNFATLHKQYETIRLELVSTLRVK